MLQSEARKLFKLIFVVSKVLRRHFETASQSYDLTMAQWRTLGHLGTEDGISQARLASETDSDPMTVSGVLERLEAKELLSRHPDPNDSRAKIVTLTEKGRAHVKKMRAVADELQQMAFAGIPEEDLEATVRAVSKISENLNAHSACDLEKEK